MHAQAAVNRLKRRTEFLAAARGRRVETGPFLMQGRDRRDGSDPRIGFTVTKRTGSAVERNRIRRRLRAAANTVLKRAGQAGFDYVLIARRPALTAPYEAIVQEMERALARLHGRKRGNPENGGMSDG